MSDTQPSSPQHFANADLAGSTFEHVDLRSSRFHHVDLRAADIRNVDLTGSRLHEVDLVDVRIDGEGWPPPKPFPVRQCLLIVLNEEWQHRLYAERDLDALLDA